jgi:hypothetical protein
MEAEIHNQFTDGVKSLNAFAALVTKTAKELEHLRAFIVQQENDAVSVEKQLKAKREEIAEMDRQVKNKRLMADTNVQAIHDRLNERNLKLVEREAKVALMEKAVEEQLRKANSLTAAAEAGSSPKRKAVAAV